MEPYTPVALTCYHILLAVLVIVTYKLYYNMNIGLRVESIITVIVNVTSSATNSRLVKLDLLTQPLMPGSV